MDENVVMTIEAGPRSVLSNAGTPISTNSTEYLDSGWVKSRTGADGQKTTYEYYPDGQLKFTVDALNHTNFYAYDEAGRQKYMVDALNRTNRFEYDAVGRMIKTTFADNTSTTNLFNLLGQRVGVKDQAGLETQFAYDLSGQLTNVTKPQVLDPLNGNNPATPAWAYQYDAYGRLAVTTDPNAHSTTNTCDQFGRPVARLLPMGGAGETNFYNAKGQLTNHYDFKRQRMEMRYDQFGRLTNKFYFAANDLAHPSNSVRYIFNQLGQLTNITERTGNDAGSGYAALGGRGGGSGTGVPPVWGERVLGSFLASLGKVPTGMWGGFAALLLCAFALNCIPREKRRLLWCVVEMWRAQLLSLAPSDGERARVRGFSAFIASLRLTQPASLPRRLRLPHYGWRIATIITLICLIGSDPHFSSLWTARAACTIPANDSTPTTRITTFGYDLEGRLAQVNSPEGVINYGYHLATGRHTSTCTANSEFSYDYDSLGRLWKVNALKRNSTNLPIPETTTYTYTAVGSREKVTLPNGVETTYQYDSLNRLTNLVNSLGGTNLLSKFTYQVDATGRRTNATEIVKTEDVATPYQTNTLRWAYDGLYRLTNEVCIATVSGGSYTNAYQYDKAGNRWQKIRYAGGSTSAITNQYNANDQLLKEVTLVGGAPTQTNTYAYDANGSVTGRTNLTTGGTVTTLYGYDLKNKLSSVKQGANTLATYLYNDQGIRVRATTGTTTLYLVDANNHTGYAQVLEELNTLGGTPTKSYVLGDDVLAQATSTASYLLYDGHGSTRQLANPSGGVTSRYNFDAYGTTLGTSTGTPETSLLYCGEQYDSTLNMYNLRARFYDPSNGRFNAMDSFKGNKEDPQSLHKYAYAHCDPVNGMDPSGEFLLLDLLFSSVIRWVLAGVKVFASFIAKRIVEKKILIITGALTGFITGFMAGLFAEVAGVEQDPLLLGVIFAVAGAVQGLLAPLSMKASALFGFCTTFIATLVHDYKVSGEFNIGKAIFAGFFGALGALAGSFVESILIGAGVKYAVFDQFGNFVRFVPAEEIVDVLAVNVGAIFGDLIASFLWVIPEVLFLGTVHGQSVKPLLEN